MLGMSFPLDVRRLAAIDMWGSAGAGWRRWVILAEFLLGAAGAGALGIVAISSGGPRAVLGYWLIGVAANYVPLSAHALALIRPGALESELREADISSELRHYTAAQFWVVVPLLVMVLAVHQRRDRR